MATGLDPQLLAMFGEVESNRQKEVDGFSNMSPKMMNNAYMITITILLFLIIFKKPLLKMI